MKILILTNFSVGLYKFRLELIDRMLKDGCKVTIALPDGEFVEDMVSMGCKFIEINLNRRGMNPLKDISLMRSYSKIIRGSNPDVVLTYTIKPNVYGGIACQLSKTPYIANVTGLGTFIENGGISQKIALFLYKVGLKKASCVFFQNQANKKLFMDSGIVAGKTALIPGSGVNLSYHQFCEYPPETEQIRFLFVGRLMRDKGISELFFAAKTVRETRPDVFFDVVGMIEDDIRHELDALIDQGAICYHGEQKDVRPYISRSFAIILPSYHEGTANVLLEASAAGRPVIASLVPGCQETFDDGVTGLGVIAKDADDLTRKTLAFLEFPHAKKVEMGLSARRKMEMAYDRQTVVDKYMSEINASNTRQL